MPGALRRGYPCNRCVPACKKGDARLTHFIKRYYNKPGSMGGGQKRGQRPSRRPLRQGGKNAVLAGKPLLCSA